MVYGIRKGWAGGGRTLCNSHALVVQPCGQCRWPGAVNGCLIRAQKPQTKRISCKGQDTGTSSRRSSTLLSCRRCLRPTLYLYTHTHTCIHVYLQRSLYIDIASQHTTSTPPSRWLASTIFSIAGELFMDIIAIYSYVSYLEMLWLYVYVSIYILRVNPR